MTDAASTFEAHRERLLRLAYGMLGRVSRAEDMVQDAYLRWRTVDPDEVDDPEAYLSTIVTRLCLDELTSARAEREQYTGPWLPEPVVETESHPDVPIEETSELSMALLVLLDDLRPVERAVYVLREAFGRPYAEIARLVDRTEAHCRKIAQRARTRIDANGDDIDAPPAAHAELLGPFVEALKRGDPEALAEMLADDVTHYTDGGDLPGAAKRPIRGLDRVTRFYLNIAPDADVDVEVRPVRVNGRPGLLAVEDGSAHSVWAFRVVDGQIQTVYAVMNPEKLPSLPSEKRPDSPTSPRLRSHTSDERRVSPCVLRMPGRFAGARCTADAALGILCRCPAFVLLFLAGMDLHGTTPVMGYSRNRNFRTPPPPIAPGRFPE